MFSCVFTEKRTESGHTTIKPRSVDCCSDVCPSVDFSYLHIWSWSSTRVAIRFLVTTLTFHPSPSIGQFGQEASSRKSPGCFKLLLWIMEATCFCEPSMKQNFFLNSSPDVWLDAILFLSSTGRFFFTSGLGFCSDMHFQPLKLLLRRVCLSISYSFNLICLRLTSLKV